MFLFQVALGRVLKAVVTFKGILIEWVVVRAHNESLLDEDGKVRRRYDWSSNYINMGLEKVTGTNKFNI